MKPFWGRRRWVQGGQSISMELVAVRLLFFFVVLASLGGFGGAQAFSLGGDIPNPLLRVILLQWLY